MHSALDVVHTVLCECNVIQLVVGEAVADLFVHHAVVVVSRVQCRESSD